MCSEWGSREHKQDNPFGMCPLSSHHFLQLLALRQGKLRVKDEGWGALQEERPW